MSIHMSEGLACMLCVYTKQVITIAVDSVDTHTYALGHVPDVGKLIWSKSDTATSVP